MFWEKYKEFLWAFVERKGWVWFFLVFSGVGLWRPKGAWAVLRVEAAYGAGFFPLGMGSVKNVGREVSLMPFPVVYSSHKGYSPSWTGVWGWRRG